MMKRAACLVDSHCHVDLYPDPFAVVAEIERLRIYTIAVSNTPSVFDRLVEITHNSQFVRVALGLHPELANQRYRELDLFDTLISRTRFVGEIGLDYQTTDEANRQRQRHVFTHIIDMCNQAGDKIATVHSRRAADDVVDAFGEKFCGRYILHWYSGSARALMRAVNNGAYFSVNPSMARSVQGRSLLARIPRTRILTESDGPFVQVGIRPALPADVRLAVSALAEIWNVDDSEAQTIIYSNFRAVLGDNSERHMPNAST